MCRNRPRGFTLLEITIAFGILLTVMLASWSLFNGAKRNEQALWGELAAGELAASALEEALAGGDTELTPPEGRRARPAVVLHVTALPERDDLQVVRAVVTWEERGQVRTLERSIRLRANSKLQIPNSKEKDK